MSAPRTAEVLRRFTAPRAAASADERCDLCRSPLAGEHPHLVDLGSRRLLCACPPCALLFDHRGASVGRFKRVPTARRRLRGLRVAADFWERMQIPVRLAFLFENSDVQRTVAFYPGPAGATESLLPLDAWRELVAANVRDKGLVVFTACSHAGVVNVLEHVRSCFPEAPLHAVVGGLHLSGGNEKIIPDTVESLRRFGLSVIAAGHCTGWRALTALANAFGEASLAPLAVGKRLRF